MKAPPPLREAPAAVEFPTHSSCAVERWRQGAKSCARDMIAEEVPVAMVYNGISHAVMLATPNSLESFGLGFSLSEGILQNRREMHSLEVFQRQEGIELQMSISNMRFAELKDRRRNLSGRTGCGLCGTESLQQVRRHPGAVQAGQSLRQEMIHIALGNLPAMQSLQTHTGAVHAAAWADADGAISVIEEDIGRHNALDKLIGTMVMKGRNFSGGFLIVTSRASYEMVQKAATLGIAIMVAVSAPTSMAIELAEQTEVTLVGFARSGSHVLYTHADRFNM